MSAEIATLKDAFERADPGSEPTMPHGDPFSDEYRRAYREYLSAIELHRSKDELQNEIAKAVMVRVLARPSCFDQETYDGFLEAFKNLGH